MRNRNILVKAYAGEYGIDFRTVSRNRKSPHRFYILRDKLAELERNPEIIVHDIYSFAVLHLNSYTGMLYPRAKKFSRFLDARGHIRTTSMANHSAREYRN